MKTRDVNVTKPEKEPDQLNPPSRLSIGRKNMKGMLTSFVLAVGVMLPHWTWAAGPAPVELNSCLYFSILAGASITSTGSGIIDGDVGLNPGTSQGIPPAQINGDVYVNEAVSALAQTHLTTAYNDAMGRSTDRNTVSGTIGNGQTLPPGLYGSASSLGISGDLTLAGGSNDVWIFQVGSSLTTDAGVGPQSRIILSGGAQAKNVFWQVGSSATLGTYSIFVGTILAQDSITLNTDCVLDGRALARTGTVTFEGLRASMPPEIEVVITAPTNGYSYIVPSSVTVLVSAVSMPYALDRVEVVVAGYIYTIALGADYTDPYEFIWTNALAGDYVLTATAWDVQGNMATSAPVTISGTSLLWSEAINFGDGGWRWLSWFGFFEEDGNGWIWHNEHGWMYTDSPTTASIWLFTTDQGWLWTSATEYPYMYRWIDDAWLWYSMDSWSPRWFYNLSTSTWEAR